jgi:membrane-associated protease RseP (regulator of RpoE activity)
MNKKNWLVAAGAAALGLGLIALPSPSKSFQEPQVAPAPPLPPGATLRVAPDMEDENDALNIVTSFGDQNGSWLGVETREVTSEKAKELKLPTERGALVGKVLQDSPAAKSGLKDGDVVTEINGQRVEGTAQFRRMIREIPAGRTVQLTVWRDGRTQTLSATLGKMAENHALFAKAAPQVFKFRVPDMPNMPEVAPMPEIEGFDWDGGTLMGGKPRLGIDAEDLNDQLGSYFGAPDGEGILVRSVNQGSAAEKAGVKAGDVITSLNGERIHGLAELRSKLAGAGDGKTVKLGVLRNKSALTLDVEVPSAKVKSAHRIEMRTKI